ncbi:MAG: hypothetical protein HY520_02540 [Candidatus Aenigmarchaeota archaeon]|nr:hypothetical protein [Candidatus Aenigmarchaeota archaeon]
MRSTSRKGQQVFEFIVATVLFIGIIIFVLNLLNANVSLYTQDYFTANREAKAIAASEALVKTSGGVGLTTAWPVLDTLPGGKMDAFAARCAANPSGVLTELGLDHMPGVGGRTYDLRAEAWILGDTGPRMVCGPSLSQQTGISTVKRVAISPTGQLLNLTVWVW